LSMAKKAPTTAEIAEACMAILDGVEFYLDPEEVQSLRDTYKQEFETIEKAWIKEK
jgi:hypothetical protein